MFQNGHLGNLINGAIDRIVEKWREHWIPDLAASFSPLSPIADYLWISYKDHLKEMHEWRYN